MQASSEDTTLHLYPRHPDPARGLALALDLHQPSGPVALDPARLILVGSARSADLRIDDPTVSARHARIGGDARGIMIEDLGSTNGTYVDGVRIQRAWLTPGLRVGLGGFRATVVARDAPARPRERPNPPGMIGSSAVFQDMLSRLRKFAALGQAVLLRGETGTGKELAARALHSEGPRAGGPFVAVNCGAIPEGLFESELFGHVRGAFTGAARAHVGAFVRAHRGTLFLDEIAELPFPLQAKLLRVLETKRFERVGGARTLEADVRWVAATNRDLHRMMETGTFREDLYHRLAVFPIRLPPLRERREDLPALAATLLSRIGAEVGRPGLRLGEAALQRLVQQPWPGNARELRNVLERAAILTEGDVVEVSHLWLDAAPASSVPHPGDAQARLPDVSLEELEKRAIAQALAAESNNRKRAAARLGIGLRTLYDKLRRYELLTIGEED